RFPSFEGSRSPQGKRSPFHPSGTPESQTRDPLPHTVTFCPREGGGLVGGSRWSGAMAGSGDSLSGLSYTRAVTDWDAFFDSLYFETYIPRLDSKDAGPEALAAVELSGATPGADVLDCPCGFGRHSIPIADAGYRVVGVDR